VKNASRNILEGAALFTFLGYSVTDFVGPSLHSLQKHKLKDNKYPIGPSLHSLQKHKLKEKKYPIKTLEYAGGNTGIKVDLIQCLRRLLKG